ncbi:MAG: aminotransferase class V-fold PLP-dependent enzyme [Clostridiales bacterium]|nr:aminotransferase class V-fold PLP-dependent enzyme [Clostridiales bacterium]
MISFQSDYIQGAHPKILENLIKTNFEALSGYSTDKYCDSAKEKIKKSCNKSDAEVFFLVGGTQANQVVISTCLRNYQGVISAVTGHINAHEAGAVEYTGHKVLPLPNHKGKIDTNELNDFVETFYADDNHEHMVFPGMVYISHPTEYGTLYTKDELTKISEICKKYDMILFIDGARLGYGIMSNETDVTLEDIAKLCDVFYIGGTKVGALCGEAVVFTHNNAPNYFMTTVKQHGAMIAKGRLLGIQFDTLFTDNLYFEISKHAILMAEKLKKLFKDNGYKFFIDSPTNQQFIVLENAKMEELKKNVQFGFWEKYDDNHTVVRFATSWATTEEDINELSKYI